MKQKVTIVADFEKLGSLGGKATAANRTAQERKEAARKAIEARWNKYYAAHPEKRHKAKGKK